jgi:H+/Cl- antiporter ClcA
MANITPCDKWELIIFPFLGIFFGYLSKLYLMLIQFMFVNIAKPNNPTRPLVVAFLISLASALIELSIGAFDPNYFGVKDMITNCLGLGNVVQMEKFGNIHPTLGAFIYAMAYPVLAAGSMQCALPAGL